MEQVFLYNKILSHCTSEFSPILLGGLKIQPVVFHFTKEYSRNEIFEHQHRFVELSWMIEGKMGYQLGKELKIVSDENKNFIFIPAETNHIRISQGCVSNIIGFLLDLSPQNHRGELFLNEVTNYLRGKNCCFEHVEFLNDFEEKLLKELNSASNVFVGKINFYIYEFLFKLFAHFFAEQLRQNSDEHKIFYDRDILAGSAKQFIEENLSHQNHVKFLAKQFNVSTRHLNRVFTEQTGSSIGQYIIQRKLNAAQKMLYNSKFSVKEIADTLGFKCDSYFFHFFKKYTGMTPREYSKKINKS